MASDLLTSLICDVALKIASSLEVPDLSSLGCCSRVWRELCGSDCLWESLVKERWPLLYEAVLKDPDFKFNGWSQRRTQDFKFEGTNTNQPGHSPPLPPSRSASGWRGFYIKQHEKMRDQAASVVKLVEQCSLSESLEFSDYLKAIECLKSMQFGFKDVQMLLFKPKLNVLLNLVGLHYCLHRLQVPASLVMEALQSNKISDRQVCVKWWKRGRWFDGFRMPDESHSRCVSLEDLATANEEVVLGVLDRGAIHEVFRVQISFASSTSNLWYT